MDVYLYADETGNLDYGGATKQGASPYFGFGTAVFIGDHGVALMRGMRLRTHVSSKGIRLARGFHAVDDSNETRGEVFPLVAELAPRIDTTFLAKSQAYETVRAKGEMYLYKLAWYLHFKEIATRVSGPDDTLYVIAGTFGTRKRQAEAEAALRDVCNQVDRQIKLCVWEASSSWGLQVADYALWATHRNLVGRSCHWYDRDIAPVLETTFLPWGREAGTEPGKE